MAKINTQVQQFLVVCAPKADVEAQHSVIQAAQFSAVLEQVTSVTQSTVVAAAELSVTMVQEQDHAVQKPGAEILTNVADLVAPRSLLVILTVLVQHTITWQFLQDCLPVMAV
jgi:hypothetical protein